MASSSLNETSLGLPDVTPVGLANGPLGGVWAAENAGGIARYDALGGLSSFSVPANSSGQQAVPEAMTSDSNGNVWLGDGSNVVPRIGLVNTVTGSVTFYTLPAAGHGLTSMVQGPDGNIWFTARGNAEIGKFDVSSHATTMYPVPWAVAVGGITSGPNNTLWFTDDLGSSIGSITTSGTINEYFLPEAGIGNQAFGDIVIGPDKKVWFTEPANNSIGQLDPANGNVQDFPIHTSGGSPQGITVGSDNNLWFTELIGGNVGKITTSGTVTEYGLPNALSEPNRIISGRNGELFFTESGTGNIGEFSPSSPPSASANAAAAGIPAAPYQANCPAGGAICMTEVTTGGSTKIGGNTAIPFPAGAIRVSGYLNPFAAGAQLHPPLHGSELVSQPVNVPLGILPWTGITITQSLAGPIMVDSAAGDAGTFTVPLTLHINNPLLGSGCQISPVNATLSPVSLSGTNGHNATDYTLLRATGVYEAKDTTAAVPAATGCGLLTGTINAIMGLPSASGKNTIDLPLILSESAGIS